MPRLQIRTSFEKYMNELGYQIKDVAPPQNLNSILSTTIRQLIFSKKQYK